MQSRQFEFTPSSAPSTAPDNVAIDAITSMDLSLSWDPLPAEHQNGMIRSYTIAVLETETGMTLQLSTTTESITLQNLHPYYTYLVEVSAYTIAHGPSSSPLSVTTEQDGSAFYIVPCMDAVSIVNLLSSLLQFHLVLL